MQDIVITLVFMMALLMFAAFPAYRIAEWITGRYGLSHRMQNLLTLIWTVVLALGAALFLKLG